jgi:hypothetical protein
MRQTRIDYSYILTTDRLARFSICWLILDFKSIGSGDFFFQKRQSIGYGATKDTKTGRM